MSMIHRLSTCFLPLLCGVLLWTPGRGQSSILIGGTVLDSETKSPVPLVNVVLQQTYIGAATDSGGYFEIRNVPEGNHVVEFRHIGYHPTWRVLNAEAGDRIMITVELTPRAIPMKELEVTAPPTRPRRLEEISASVVVSSEEIRRRNPPDMTTLIRQSAPMAFLSQRTLRLGLGQSSIVYYLDGVRVDAEMVEQLPVQDIQRVVVWRSKDAPVQYRTGAARYVIGISTMKDD